MSNHPVENFCTVVASDPSLQDDIKKAITHDQGLERFVELAVARGHSVTMESARECFQAERERREAAEGEGQAETVVMGSSHASSLNNVDPARAGFRRVALSGNWHIGASDSESQNESIHD